MKHREYEMSTEQLLVIMDAITIARNAPQMRISGTFPDSPKETAHKQWVLLGKAMGFDGMTTKPIPGKGDRFFTAKPTVIENTAENEPTEETITISVKEHDRLLWRESVLDALESGGVDNWEWYSESLKPLYKDEEN
jgi:hypothetical protein